MKSLILISLTAIFLCSCGYTDATKKQAWYENASGEKSVIATPPGTRASFEIVKPDGTIIKATIDDKTEPWWRGVVSWVTRNPPEYTLSN